MLNRAGVSLARGRGGAPSEWLVLSAFAFLRPLQLAGSCLRSARAVGKGVAVVPFTLCRSGQDHAQLASMILAGCRALVAGIRACRLLAWSLVPPSRPDGPRGSSRRSRPQGKPACGRSLGPGGLAEPGCWCCQRAGGAFHLPVRPGSRAACEHDPSRVPGACGRYLGLSASGVVFGPAI